MEIEKETGTTFSQAPVPFLKNERLQEKKCPREKEYPQKNKRLQGKEHPWENECPQENDRSQENECLRETGHPQKTGHLQKQRKRKEKGEEPAPHFLPPKTRPWIQLRLEASRTFFGPGPCELLEWVEKTGSIQEACARMGLSYSKGSRLIRDMERELGWPVTVRHTGGTGGGGTVLTDGGKRLVDRYRRLQAEADQAVEELYRKYFGE